MVWAVLFERARDADSNSRDPHHVADLYDWAWGDDPALASHRQDQARALLDQMGGDA